MSSFTFSGSLDLVRSSGLRILSSGSSKITGPLDCGESNGTPEKWKPPKNPIETELKVKHMCDWMKEWTKVEILPLLGEAQTVKFLNLLGNCTTKLPIFPLFFFFSSGEVRLLLWEIEHDQVFI